MADDFAALPLLFLNFYGASDIGKDGSVCFILSLTALLLMSQLILTIPHIHSFFSLLSSLPLDLILEAMDYAVYKDDVKHIILDNLQVGGASYVQ